MNPPKIVIDFNHISKSLDRYTIIELKKLYHYYHKLAICYKWKYKKLKKRVCMFNLLSISLTSGGAIAGGITLNPLIIGVVTGIGVIIQSYIVKANLNNKVQHYKSAYTSYDKILIELRAYLRGLDFNEIVFLSNVKVIDDTITDLGLTYESMLEKYTYTYIGN